MDPIQVAEITYDQNGELRQDLFKAIKEITNSRYIRIWAPDNNFDAKLTIQYRRQSAPKTPPFTTINSDKKSGYFLIHTITNFKVEGDLTKPITVRLQLTNPKTGGPRKSSFLDLVLKPQTSGLVSGKIKKHSDLQTKSSVANLFGSK